MSGTDTTAPMRLRAEPPRVTQLSRKVLAGAGAIALLGIGGALIYALQTHEAGPGGGELYSTENRPTADGLAGLPRDYTGPVLGPALPGDLGRPILEAQNRGQPVVPPTIATPTVDPDEQRRLAEEEAARLSNVFFQSGPRTGAPAGAAMPGLGLGGQPATQDRHTAFLNGPVDRQTVAPAGSCRAVGIALHPSGRGRDPGRAHHRHPFRSARPDHRAGDGARL